MRSSITLGTWEGSPLEWLVLEDKDSVLTLWCRRVVARKVYNENGSAYYAESDVRRFLEGEFYEKAFSDEERSRILPTVLDCTEYQTYYGAVGVGASAYRRDPLTDKVFLLSVREIMKTYALSNEEIYHPDGGMLWTRCPEGHTTVSLICCNSDILRGESPYEYESRSYDHTTGMVDSTTFPYSCFADRQNCVVPALRIRK